MLDRRHRPRLGRYEVLFRLAAGGMAEVFVGRLVGEGGFVRYVAIKRMLPHLAEDARFVQMFLDEGRLAGHVSSPHVVPVLDVGRDDEGALFIVMELVRGVALHGLIVATKKTDRQLIPLDVAATILSDAARGLHDAHEAVTPVGEPMALVHRDVSPQNLLVGADGRTRITDFGVARAIQRNTATVAGELKGKLGYFAPEQAKGQVDRRTDVFALGIVAWEMLVGRRLFDGDGPLERLEKVQRMPIPSVRSLRPEISGALDAIIARALQRDPAARFQTAGELAGALRDAGVALADADEVGVFVRSVMPDALRTLESRLVRAAQDDADGPMTAELSPDGPVQTTIEPVTPLGEGDLVEATNEHDRTRVRTSVTPHLALEPHPRSSPPARGTARIVGVVAIVAVAAGVGGAIAMRAPTDPAVDAAAQLAEQTGEQTEAPRAASTAPAVEPLESAEVEPAEAPRTPHRDRPRPRVRAGRADTPATAGGSAAPAGSAPTAGSASAGRDAAEDSAAATRPAASESTSGQMTSQPPPAPAPSGAAAAARPTSPAPTKQTRPPATPSEPEPTPTRTGALRGVDAFDRGVQ